MKNLLPFARCILLTICVVTLLDIKRAAQGKPELSALAWISTLLLISFLSTMATEGSKR